MNALFLGHAHTNGCRTAYFFPYLEKRGIRAAYVDIPSGSARREALERLPRAGCVLVQRLSLSDREISVLRRSAQRLVYDIDDPVMYRSSRHWIRWSPTRRRNFRRMVEAADAVIASSPLIAAEAERYLPADRVTLVPSTVDGTRYRPAARARDGTPGMVTLGWLGSAGTAHFLQRLRHVLAEIGRRHANVRLKIVSNRFPELEGIEIERKPWRQEDEITDLQSFDIALLPLTDDLWTRGKGHGKLFQYMAVGAAIVASPVGIVAEALEPGRTGLFARRRAEWVEAVGSLVESAALRRDLGGAARASFEKRWSLQAALPRFMEALTGKPGVRDQG